MTTTRYHRVQAASVAAMERVANALEHTSSSGASADAERFEPILFVARLGSACTAGKPPSADPKLVDQCAKVVEAHAPGAGKAFENIFAKGSDLASFSGHAFEFVGAYVNELLSRRAV